MTRITFWQGLRSTYVESLAFIRACPWLALVPVVFEMLQHVVEVRIGMYDSLAAAQASEDDPMRMAFGFLKVFALTVPTYWVMRFLPRRDAAFAARLDAGPLRLFGVFLAVQIALAAIDLFVLPRSDLIVALAVLAGLVEGCLMSAWAVAAPWGNAAIGLLASIRLMARRLPWTFALQVAVLLPLMIPHYALGMFAIFVRKSLLWPTLTLDALLVGYLTPVMIAGSYFAARRAADLAGVSLLTREDDAALGAAGTTSGFGAA